MLTCNRLDLGTLGSQALATPIATSMKRWPLLAEQQGRLPHKRHLVCRLDDVSKYSLKRNYQGIPTGNLWNPAVATPWPTEAHPLSPS